MSLKCGASAEMSPQTEKEMAKAMVTRNSCRFCTSILLMATSYALRRCFVLRLRLGCKRTVQVVSYRRVVHSGLCWSRSSDNSSSRLGTWSGGGRRRGAAQATHQLNDNPVNPATSDLT